MTPLELAAVGVFGLMIGSFLNVCISRLPAGESIVSPGSRCGACRTPILWRDNLPIVSYLLLRGRCRKCHAAIGIRYLIVEAVTMMLFVAQASLEPAVTWSLASRLMFTALLIALAATDLETFRLPNPLTRGGIALGLAFSVVTPIGLTEAVLGAVVGAGVLWIIRWAWLKATGVDAMGLGDVKMLAMIGAFLGWQQVWLVLLLSTVVGAMVGVGLMLGGRSTLGTRLPFGVFLAAAALVASLCGPALIAWYLGMVAPG